MTSLRACLIEAIEDYQGSHGAPDKDGAPLHNLNGMYPDDIYSNDGVRLYGDGMNYDHASITHIKMARNKPNYRVTIYRAIPNDLSKADKIKTFEKHKKYIQQYGKVPPDADTNLGRSDYYGHCCDELDKLHADNSEDIKPKINSGDWVTMSREYAVKHGQGSLNGRYKILSKTVPAKHLFTDGNSINEWGYNP